MVIGSKVVSIKELDIITLEVRIGFFKFGLCYSRGRQHQRTLQQLLQTFTDNRKIVGKDTAFEGGKNSHQVIGVSVTDSTYLFHLFRVEDQQMLKNKKKMC